MSRNTKSFLQTVIKRSDLLDSLTNMFLSDRVQYLQVIGCIEQNGVSKKDVAELKSLLKHRSKSLTTNEIVPVLKQRIKDVLPDAPVADDAVMPSGYVLCSDFSIILTRKPESWKPIEVLAAPIFISAIEKDIVTSNFYVMLSWQSGKEWKAITVGRQVIARYRMLAALLRSLMPVSSKNASKVVDFFSCYEHENRHNILIKHR
jgi:hypothetical protein